MAWDGPRRCDPLPRSLRRPNSINVDELDFYQPSTHLDNINSTVLDMHGQLLSPIQEERPFPASNAPLQIHVTAKFHDPAIRFTYNRSYHSSQSFIPSERICRGLMRRIRHCSEEVITRKDSDALNPAQCLRKGPKHLRFELIFQVVRAGHSGIWAEMSFQSHQKHALTNASAKDVLQSTHRIVGLFMRRHDKGFEWTDEPGYDHFPNKPETFKPSQDGDLNLACVPRSLFIESRQTWEFVTGYSVEFTFKSHNPERRRAEIRKTLRVDSRLNTPLNLGLGEDLLWQAHRSLQDVLDQKKSSFDLEHATCDGFEGVPDCGCQHFDQNALDIGLRIINNLGPVYDHLHRRTESRLRLFTHWSGQDCDEFSQQILARLNQLRNQTDEKLKRMNDFDFRVAELTGHGWREKNCARFIIDGEHQHSRTCIQALLDRIRTGVSDVLRGNDVAIRMIAYKRGHLVLDKALIARNHQSQVAGPGSMNIAAKDQQQRLLAQLKTRIQHDIDMICKDTCQIDDILELGPETWQQKDLCQLRQRALSSSRPFTPCHTPQRQIRPESPANFATRPPTPPEIPTRSSSRVFPLVPAKYQVEKKPRSKALSSAKEKHLAVGVEVPRIVLKDDHNDTNRTNDTGALKPAAEVYPASKEEYETDSNSTHSSMPALTESDDTPSPEQSMLITPSCVRSSSPAPHERPSIEDLQSHHFSSPFVMDTSASSGFEFPDVHRFDKTKSAAPKSTNLPSGRPGTPKKPETEQLVPVNTPKALGDVHRDEKTPMPCHVTQGNNETSGLENASNGLISTHGAVEVEPLKTLSRDLPTESAAEDRLLCHVEKESSSETLAETHREAEMPECDSSETLRPSAVLQQRSIGGLAKLRGNELDDHRSSTAGAPAADGSCHEVSDKASVARHSVPTGQAGLSLEADSVDDELRATALGDELSRSKIDFFEQDDGSAIDPEAVEDRSCIQAVSRRVGMSEKPESTGHVIPFSDSGIDIETGSEATDNSGAEFQGRHTLSPIDESAFEFDVDHYDPTLQGPGTYPTEARQERFSGPWVIEDARREDRSPPIISKDSLTSAVELPESPSEKPGSAKNGSTSASTQSTESVKLPKVRTSGPVRTARAVSNPQSSPGHIGLSGVQLLPSLPIFSALRSVSHDTRASWSTSSSWEDYISAGRQSSDSVDTIKACPTDSEKDDHPDSPKRLGTPTAGLLGLHETRWAEFGIRTALTGTHAFDRPSTAPVPESPVIAHHQAKTKGKSDHTNDKMVQESSSLPRKTFHLRQKSIGSTAAANMSKRKESKSLRQQKSVELKTLKKSNSKSSRESTVFREDDDGAARFPRAMMLVAGLAFASSVVSRNHT